VLGALIELQAAKAAQHHRPNDRASAPKRRMRSSRMHPRAPGYAMERNIQRIAGL
jgi:hypothetical protein